MLVKIGNSEFWVDETERNGQVYYVQKQIDSKDFKMLDGQKNAFCLFCWFFEEQLHF